MTDIGASLAVGLAGFMAGMAYAHRNQVADLRSAAVAGAILIGDRAFLLAPLRPEPAPKPAPIPPDRLGETCGSVSGGCS